MAAPTAVLRMACLAAVLAQARSSPFWSQPQCPDQNQGGYWSGASYENQGPSYQQTLHEMVSETVKCIQQVIQVTKREMMLLLAQLAQDGDCETPGDDVTSGQVQFPPPNSEFSHDRPQEQLEYPAQYRPDSPQTQSPPEVQTHYQNQAPLKETPYSQPQYLPVSQPGYYQPPAPIQPTNSHQIQPQTQIQTYYQPQAQLQETHQVQPQYVPVYLPGYYQPPPTIQETPQIQPQFLPDIELDYNSDALGCQHDRKEHHNIHEVPTYTVEDKISLTGTVGTSPSDVESTSTTSQNHMAVVEKPFDMVGIKTINASSDEVPGGNGLTSPNAPTSNTSSNTSVISQSSYSTYLTENISIGHDDMSEYNDVGSQSTVPPSNGTTQEDAVSPEKTPSKDKSKEENISISLSSSPSTNISNIPNLVNRSPISLPIASYTTVRSNDTNDSHTENSFTVPYPLENEVDVTMNNISDKSRINDKNSSSDNRTTLPKPLEQRSENNFDINLVTSEYNKSEGLINTNNASTSLSRQNITTSTNEDISSNNSDTTVVTSKNQNGAVSISRTGINFVPPQQNVTVPPTTVDRASSTNPGSSTVTFKYNTSEDPITTINASIPQKYVTSSPKHYEQTFGSDYSKAPSTSLEITTIGISIDKTTQSTNINEAGSTFSIDNHNETQNATANTNSSSTPMRKA